MINVSCAVIKNKKGEILATQRSAFMKMPLKWEFPGGKIEQGETAEGCLIREIKEELGVKIIITAKLKASIYHYDHFIVNLVPFLCEITSGKITLAEHAEYLWLKPKELLNLDWAEADIPVMKNLLNY